MSLELIEARKNATRYVYATGRPDETFLNRAKDAVEDYRKLCDSKKPRSEEAANELQTATNTIQKELTTEMENAKSRAAFFGNLALVLYVIGSALALYGAAFEKGFPKSVTEVSVTSQLPEHEIVEEQKS